MQKQRFLLLLFFGDIVTTYYVVHPGSAEKIDHVKLESKGFILWQNEWRDL